MRLLVFAFQALRSYLLQRSLGNDSILKGYYCLFKDTGIIHFHDFRIDCSLQNCFDLCLSSFVTSNVHASYKFYSKLPYPFLLKLLCVDSSIFFLPPMFMSQMFTVYMCVIQYRQHTTTEILTEYNFITIIEAFHKFSYLIPCINSLFCT